MKTLILMLPLLVMWWRLERVIVWSRGLFLAMYGFGFILDPNPPTLSLVSL